MTPTGPQLENGYCKIANEIIEALSRYRIPGEQMQVLMAILRKTYGFNKKEDSISNSQFVKATGLKKGNVSRALSNLVEREVVIKTDNKRIPTYRFNKDYRDWKLLSKLQPVIKKATAVIKITTPVIKSDNSLLDKRHFTKDTLTKDTPKRKKPNGKTLFPDDFMLTEKLIQYATERNIDPKKIDELFENFKDYHIGHGTKMLDWSRAWFTFVRNAPQFSPWAMDKKKEKRPWHIE